MRFFSAEQERCARSGPSGDWPISSLPPPTLFWYGMNYLSWLAGGAELGAQARAAGSLPLRGASTGGLFRDRTRFDSLRGQTPLVGPDFQPLTGRS
jgi:hypothetical protein